MKFKEVNRQELQKYYQEDRNLVNESYLDEIIQLSERLHRELLKLQEYEKDKKLEKLFMQSRRVVVKSEALTQKIRGIPIEYGDADAYKNLKYDLAAKASDIGFFYEDGVLQIILPELVPKRWKSGEIFENLDYIRCSYREAFREYFSKQDIFFHEQILLEITHVYTKEEEVLDHDNLDTKIITDLIAEFVLVDDDPRHCKYLIDYRIGERKHSEFKISAAK